MPSRLTQSQINHVTTAQTFSWRPPAPPAQEYRIVPLVEGMKWKFRFLPQSSSWYYAADIRPGHFGYYVLISDSECIYITQTVASQIERIGREDEWIKFIGEGFVRCTPDLWTVIVIKDEGEAALDKFNSEADAFKVYTALAYPVILPGIKSVEVHYAGKKVRGVCLP